MGDVLHQYPLGTAVTDRHGTFVLPVSVRTVPDKYIEGSRAAGAFINLEVEIATQDHPSGAI